MTAVISEVSPQILYGIYILILLPIWVLFGFEIAEKVVARREKRKSHTLINLVNMGVCLAWMCIAFFVSGPIANYFNQTGFHSQLEKELEVSKLVSSDGSEIEVCTREIVDTKRFEVKWREKKEEHYGSLEIRPNGNESCVYELKKR